MFSHLRHAVESLAPPHQHQSLDSNVDEQKDINSSLTSLASLTSPLSPSQLADSALSTLRQPLSTQRGNTTMDKSTSSPAVSPTPNKPRHKMNLEERLRASLASSEVSAPTPVENSATLTQTTDMVSLSSTPLPDSSKPTPSSSPSHHLLEESSATESQNEEHSKTTDTNNDEALPPEEWETKLISLAEEAKNERDNHEENVADVPPTTDCEEIEEQNIQESLTADDHTANLPEETTTIESIGTEEVSITSINEKELKVETLQRKLKEVEQRFTDVSVAFKRLQSEKLSAESVLQDFTPLSNISDAVGLKDFLVSMKAEMEVFQEEIKQLNGKLKVQESRMEEMKETHELAAGGRINQIDTLQVQLRETEVLLKESEKASVTSTEALAKHKLETDSMKTEIERLNTIVKEEEEKRTKAISLLKSVRQKLVKAEREKEDALKETATLRDKQKGDIEREQAERKKTERDIEAANAEKEKALTSLRLQYDKDTTSIRERHDKEMSAMRGQFELDAITTQSSHKKEVATKNAHISTLETSLNNVTRDKNSFFEQLQLRQAETESAQAHLESIQQQNNELQYQLREANDRYILLKEEINEMQRERELRAREPSTSAEHIAQLIAATEAKYEVKIAELKRGNATLEKERNDGEAEWSRKLKERSKEVEELKQLLGNSTKSHEQEEELITELKGELEQKQNEAIGLQHQLDELSNTCSHIKNTQASTAALTTELNTKIGTLEKHIEDSKTKESQLRQTNKTLKEELRKVQSSAALLEKQRNPGLGYWTTRPNDSRNSMETQTSIPSTVNSRVGSQTTPEPGKSNNEQEVNLEYLRNVILQFLEHKEMRADLVRVLSIILHFTPQETRRLLSKIQ